jgi:hypothetical protein
MYCRLNSDVLERLFQRVLVELLGADDVDLADRRPLLHDDHEHTIFRLETHVAKETGGVQRLDRRRRLFIVDAIANLDWKVAEHGSRIGALHAFDADILDGKRIEGQHGSRHRQREQRRSACQRGQELYACARRCPARGAVRRVGKYH